MVLSISAVVLLGIVVILLIRAQSLRIGGALAAAGFGFFLASTGLASPIHHGLASLAGLLNQITT
ncbi:hypothetical protein [Streptomyces sp. NPDC101393]|uniref:hypothetical protein n=1 Tax=Streptomyces sp. NPDC101393 TaxID=3366141 RepID=UPI00380E5F69